MEKNQILWVVPAVDMQSAINGALVELNSGVNCSTCGSASNMTKNLYIKPKFLIVGVRRFPGDYRSISGGTSIQLPVCNSADHPAVYRIKSFISHVNMGGCGGHYTVSLWNGQNFLRINDDQAVTSNNVQNSGLEKAYIYIYELVGSTGEARVERQFKLPVPVSTSRESSVGSDRRSSSVDKGASSDSDRDGGPKEGTAENCMICSRQVKNLIMHLDRTSCKDKISNYSQFKQDYQDKKKAAREARKKEKKVEKRSVDQGFKRREAEAQAKRAAKRMEEDAELFRKKQAEAQAKRTAKRMEEDADSFRKTKQI